MKIKFLLSLFVAGTLAVGAQTQGYKDGIEYYKAGQHDNARTILERTINDPATDRSLANYYLGQVALVQGDKAQARTYFDAGLAADAECPFNYVGLGALALQEGNDEAAKEQFKQAQKFGKKNAEVSVSIARAYYNADPVKYDRDITKALEKARKDSKNADPSIYVLEGDMLAALGFKYGTPLATDFSESVHKALALAAYGSSVTLAEERGAFEIFDAEREKNNPYINRLAQAEPALIERMRRHGRRNIACLTIAPTGTTSLMTRTTSGIEPVFLPVYKRRRKVNPNDAEVRIDYVDETGDAFEEYVVYHPKFIDWMKINNIEVRDDYSQEQIDDLVARSPYAGATSNDIDWLEKVKMQGRIQKWVDHSISVTINLPADVSEELVNNLYVEAWRSGCKGCTVYRDGSRSGVLVALEKKTDPTPEIKPHVAKRPIELEADVVRFQNNKEKWIAFVGLIDGAPYEIFTGLADDEDGIFCPKSVTHGKIIKAVDDKGNKRYDFQFINKRGYKTTIEGLSDKFNPEYWNYAKLISGVLRYGMPIDQVLKLVGGLELDSQSINTWKMGVERALKKYLPNGTKANGQTCPNCGQETLIYQEGCLICTSCGTSKCG